LGLEHFRKDLVMERRRKRHPKGMYVFTCTTPYGFRYNRYADSPNDAPYNAVAPARLNLAK